jgi:hypothetical protein
MACLPRGITESYTLMGSSFQSMSKCSHYILVEAQADLSTGQTI